MTALLTTTSALPAEAGTSTAEQLADEMLAAVRQNLVRFIESHKNPAVTIDRVLVDADGAERVVTLSLWQRFL